MPTPRRYPRIKITFRGGKYFAHLVMSETETIALAEEWSSFEPAFAFGWAELQDELASRARAKMPKPIPTRCPDCRRRVRKASQKASEWPGTVAMMDREGRCSACRKRKQSATIEAAKPPKTPAQELVDAVTPPHQPKVAPVLIVRPLDEEAAALVEHLEPEQPRPRGKKPGPKMPCSVEGCDGEVSRNSRTGLCTPHRRARTVDAKQSGAVAEALAKELPPIEELTPEARQAKQSLEAYWADRRRRGVPPEGTAA